MDDLPANASVVVPYWSYLVPVVVAALGAIGVAGGAYIAASVKSTRQAVQDTTRAVIVMEQRINGALEKLVSQAVAEAVAKERLHVQGILLAAAEERERESEKAGAAAEAVDEERQRVKDDTHDDEMM